MSEFSGEYDDQLPGPENGDRLEPPVIPDGQAMAFDAADPPSFKTGPDPIEAGEMAVGPPPAEGESEPVQLSAEDRPNAESTTEAGTPKRMAQDIGETAVQGAAKGRGEASSSEDHRTTTEVSDQPKDLPQPESSLEACDADRTEPALAKPANGEADDNSEREGVHAVDEPADLADDQIQTESNDTVKDGKSEGNTAKTENDQVDEPERPRRQSRIPQADIHVVRDLSGQYVLRTEMVDGNVEIDRHGDSEPDIKGLRRLSDEAPQRLTVRDAFATAYEAADKLGVTHSIIGRAVVDGAFLALRFEGGGPTQQFRIPEAYTRAFQDFWRNRPGLLVTDAAASFAASSAGHYLAWGLRAEMIETVRTQADAQEGFLSVGQARDATGISEGYLRRHGLIERAPLPRNNYLGLSAEALLGRMQWSHGAFEADDGARSVEAASHTIRGAAEVLGVAEVTLDDAVRTGRVPAWRVPTSAREKGCFIPGRYVDLLRRRDIIQSQIPFGERAMQIAQAQPYAHSIIRGQLELHLAQHAGNLNHYPTAPEAARTLGIPTSSVIGGHGVRRFVHNKSAKEIAEGIIWTYPRVSIYDRLTRRA